MNSEKTVEELHDKAMELADLGFISKQQGRQREANAYFSQACRYEEKAAIVALEVNLGQPTLGILFRSAATLASDTGDLDKLLLLAKKAISTNLLKEQKNDFLELIWQNRIRLSTLNGEEIDRLIYERKLLKIKRELNSKIKSEHQKRKNPNPLTRRNTKRYTLYHEQKRTLSTL
jgi:hypothetical protein